MAKLPKGWKDDDSFTFWLPAQAVKISKGTDKKGAPVRQIQGVASTSHSDLQGETVDQDGIDFSYFLKHGYFNNDHKPGAENKVGEPTECKVTKQGLWVKGFLYENLDAADAIWELMTAQTSNPQSKRRMGFSIEGKVKRRNGRKINECWIQDIAITPAPVNTATWAEIAKSLTLSGRDDSEQTYVEPEADSDSAMVPEAVGLSKALTPGEAIDYVRSLTGLGLADAARVVEFVETQKESK